MGGNGNKGTGMAHPGGNQAYMMVYLPINNSDQLPNLNNLNVPEKIKSEMIKQKEEMKSDEYKNRHKNKYEKFSPEIHQIKGNVCDSKVKTEYNKIKMKILKEFQAKKKSAQPSTSLFKEKLEQKKFILKTKKNSEQLVLQKSQI